MMRAIILTVLTLAIPLAGVPLTAVAQTKPVRDPVPTEAGTSPKSLAVPPAGKIAKPNATETAIFAGGCFWCTEFAFEQLDGVVDVESGYSGGTKATANYDQVHLGNTHHAEAIRVTYDSTKITYAELLDVFFDSHSPTQLNRQGEDVGRQYRSAIFFANKDQQAQAKAKIADLEAKRVYKKKIMTKIEPLEAFYPAEAYHQDFARKNPFSPYIQGHAVPKAYKIRTKHPELIKKPE